MDVYPTIKITYIPTAIIKYKIAVGISAFSIDIAFNTW